MRAARELIRNLIVRPAMRRQRMMQAHVAERRGETRFHCPVCDYRGVFISAPGPTGARRYGRCPQCGSFERHRLQAKALDTILAGFAPETKSALHFAPEFGLSPLLRERFGAYATADLSGYGVDYRCDLRRLPFGEDSFDFVFASHVLEHIQEDRLAINELYRILKPGGMAVLPVPIVCDATVEYPHPVATEDGHVRAPGTDYFERYWEIFDGVQVFSSDDFDGDSQPYIYEDRSQVPSPVLPYRRPMSGFRHPDYVPVCFKTPCHMIGGQRDATVGDASTRGDTPPAQPLAIAA